LLKTGTGGFIGPPKMVFWIEIYITLIMKRLRIKVIIISLKPNKIVKMKKYFGLNIGLSPYY
jgi:hypothetical protein